MTLENVDKNRRNVVMNLCDFDIDANIIYNLVEDMLSVYNDFVYFYK